MTINTNKIKILSVNISKEKGTVKKPVNFINLSINGIENDAHSGSGHRQISLLAKESIDKFTSSNNRNIKNGEFAENITTQGLLLHNCRPLDKLRNNSVELEITQIGKKCHGKNCSIFKETGDCIMPEEGIFARTVKEGKLSPGDELEYIQKIIKIHIITLSDRASRGEYADRSGPQIKSISEKFFNEKKRSVKTEITLIPDNPEKLKSIVNSLVKEHTDVIFTTGGTGIGPNDITPETINPMLEKEIPGIMEMIRIKYGENKPNALLSRGIAGTIDKTLVYTLPGSVKAVTEYLEVILPTLRHSILMVNGLGH